MFHRVDDLESDGADQGRHAHHSWSHTTNRVDLRTPVPVHNAYFTAWAHPNGDVLIFNDIYGHDTRYRDALSGKPLADIAARGPRYGLKKEE